MNWEHKESLWRLAIVAALFMGIGAAWLFADLPEGFGERMEGMLILLGPWLLDQLRVGNRHRKERLRASERPPPPSG